MNSQSSLTVVRLSGELDIGRREEIAAALHVPAGAAGILLDFAQVTYADSTVISELMRFRAEAERAEAQIAILLASRQFARLLQYAGLNEAFAIFTERGEALSFLNGGPG